MEKIAAMLVIAAFIGSGLSAPMALAVQASETSSALQGDTIIGVVSRGWTDDECWAEFGTRKAFAEFEEEANYPAEQRGPLKTARKQPPMQTGCYCSVQGEGDNAVHYVMNEKGTGCDACKIYDQYAVHIADEALKPIAEATIYAKDENGNEADRGCRCAAREGQRFTGVVNNKCKYAETSKEDAACSAKYGMGGESDAVKACAEPPLASEAFLGAADMAGGRSARCCCIEGATRVETLTGTPTCKKSAEGELDKYDLACMKSPQGLQASTDNKGTGVVQCPSEFNTLDTSTLTASQRDDREKSFLGMFPNTAEGNQVCCCDLSKAYVLDKAKQKCVSQKDECTAIVPGSVKKDNPNAGTNVVGLSYTGKQWDAELMKTLKEAKLENQCVCRADTRPFGDTSLTQCSLVKVEKNVTFAILDQKAFYAAFDDRIFPFLMDVQNGQANIVFEAVAEGPYKGGMILDTGGKEVTVTFHNTDTDRTARFFAEFGTIVASMGIEGIIGKGGAKVAAEATEEGVKRLSPKALKAAFASRIDELDIADKELAEHMAKLGVDPMTAAGKAIKAEELLGESYAAITRGIGRGLLGKSTSSSVDEYLTQTATTVEKAVGNNFESFIDDVLRTQTQRLSSVISGSPANIGVTLKGMSRPDAVKAILSAFKGTTVDDTKLALKALEDPIGKAVASDAASGTVSSAATGVLSRIGSRIMAPARKIVTTPAGKALFLEPTSKFLGLYGAKATELMKLAFQGGAGPLIAIGYSEISASGRKSSEMATFWESFKTAAAAGTIAGGVTLGISAIGGPIAPGVALIGGLTTGAGTFVIERNWFGAGDPTEMEIRFNDKRIGPQTLNLIITDSAQKCNRVEKDSGLKMEKTSLDTASGTFKGWSLTEFTYATSTCTILKQISLKSIEASGGYSQTEFMLGGRMNECTKCRAIPLGADCNGASTAWNEQEKLTRIGVTQALCCDECAAIEGVPLGDYYGMPGQAAAPGEGPGL